MSGRYSRSRSPRGQRRGGSRRSPPQYERPAYGRRSQSRSGSRGRDSRRGGERNDGGSKRRSKFSDSGMGGGFSGGGGFGGDHGRSEVYGMASIPGHGGFQNENPAVLNYGQNNNRNNHNHQQNNYEEPERYGAPQPQQQPQAGFQVNFGQNKPVQNENPGFDPSLITITPQRSGTQRISRKVQIPQDNKFNYIGLIIGPRGQNQKQLEEETHCKILIRGKGSQKQGQPAQPDDEEDLHVLIEADNEANANKAMREIENIILMDEEEKAKKRDSQLRSAQAYSGRPNEFQSQDPDKLSYIVVPNNCVGLVIGRKGDTIKQIKERSGADKVYMQSEANRNMTDDYQNLIVEGTQEAVEKVREIIEEIKQQQRRKAGGPNGESRIEMEIPANMAGLVIGKQGSTLQQVGQQTRTHCQMQQNSNSDQEGRKILVITGQSEEDCLQAKALFQEKINARVNGNVNPPRFHGPPGYGMMPNVYPPRPMPGRPPFASRRPRKNADGDEIVDDANQYEYYGGGYEDPMMMQNQMYAGMYMPYPPPYGYPMPPEMQQQQPPPQDPSLQGQLPPPPQAVDPSQAVTLPPQEQVASNPDPAAQQAQQQQQQQQQQQPPQQQQYPTQQFDPMQIQMQLQYQQQLYYQQMQQMQPMIQEVLADGTVVQVSQEEEEGRKGKRGGRR